MTIVAAIAREDESILRRIALEVSTLARTDAEAARRQVEVHLVCDRDPAAADILHAAIDMGIIGAFLDAATSYVTTKTRPWPGTGYSQASDDPHVVIRFGKFASAYRALEAMLDTALTAVETRADDAAQAAGIARNHALAVGRIFISGTIELMGASSTSEKYGFHAYWRNFTAHARENPPGVAAEDIGTLLVRGAEASENSFHSPA